MLFPLIIIIISVICIILLFVISPIWAWAPLFIIDLFLLIAYFAARKTYKYEFQDELSLEANQLLNKYGHYFALPFASKEYSAGAATSQFAGVVIVVLSLVRGFWLAIILGLINWFLMGFVAVSLTPIALIKKKPYLTEAHNEVFEYINRRRRT